MIDIVKDLKALEQSIYNLPCSVHGHAFMDEYRNLITKYSTPFSPSDLEAWGWEKIKGGYKIEKWIIEFSETRMKFYERYYVYDDEGAWVQETGWQPYTDAIRIPKTQIQMQMLLNLIIGGEE